MFCFKQIRFTQKGVFDGAVLLNTGVVTKRKNTSGTHENYGRPDTIRLGSDRNFGLTFAAVFMLVALFPLLTQGPPRTWALVIGLLFFVLAIVSPQVLRSFKIHWAQFGLLLQKIISPLILAFLFYFIFTPIGLLLRLCKKDVLSLKMNSDSASYWLDSESPQSTMKDQF